MMIRKVQFQVTITGDSENPFRNGQWIVIDGSPGRFQITREIVRSTDENRQVIDYVAEPVTDVEVSAEAELVGREVRGIG